MHRVWSITFVHIAEGRIGSHRRSVQ